MNAMKSSVVGVLCLSAAGLFGETYNVADVASLMEALGKAGDGDVIECAAGDYPLATSTEVFKQARIKRSVFVPLSKSAARDAGDNAFVSEATDLYGNPRVFSKDVDLGCAESQAGGMTIFVR